MLITEHTYRKLNKVSYDGHEEKEGKKSAMIFFMKCLSIEEDSHCQQKLSL